MNVIKLDEFRQKEEDKPLQVMAHYYCLKCDRDTFLLCADGTIICKTCSVLMKNLRVVADLRHAD